MSTPPAATIRPLERGDAAAVGDLHARVFGPGRFARTAYRVREGTSPLSPYCRGAFIGKRMVAALRMTEVTIGGTSGALLLGPLAVDPACAGQGHGRRLISAVMEAARAGGERLIVLVGDEPYYGRLGFKAVPPGHIRLPGPVDPARILAAELSPGALAEMRGLVEARASSDGPQRA